MGVTLLVGEPAGKIARYRKKRGRKRDDFNLLLLAFASLAKRASPKVIRFSSPKVTSEKVLFKDEKERVDKEVGNSYI
jgi:hypothetical protein